MILLIEGWRRHRLHPMIVHFPAALYPFSFVVDVIGRVSSDADYHIAGLYALFASVGTSLPALFFGLIDFLKIDVNSTGWRKAGRHGLLNLLWFMIFSTLLFYRVKQQSIDGLYLGIMAFCVLGTFYSNFLGADLLISHRIGIDRNSKNKSRKEHE